MAALSPTPRKPAPARYAATEFPAAPVRRCARETFCRSPRACRICSMSLRAENSVMWCLTPDGKQPSSRRSALKSVHWTDLTAPLRVTGRALPSHPLPEFQAIVGARERLVGDGHVQEAA